MGATVASRSSEGDMSTAIQPYQPETLDDIQRTAALLVASGYFDAKGDRNTQIAQIATKILAGREMGYPPFVAVQGIHVIQGKPSLSANLMAAAVKAHPRYDYRVRTMTGDLCEIEFFERVDGKRESLGVSSFSLADAKAAGTQNLAKFARNMLFARAMSNGVRWFCPDVFGGQAVYTPEEMGAAVDGDGEVITVNAQPIPERTLTHEADGDILFESPPASPVVTPVVTPAAPALEPEPEAADGWGGWSTPADYNAARAWGKERGAWNHPKHFEAAWSKCFGEHASAHGPAAFLTAWRQVVAEHTAQAVTP